MGSNFDMIQPDTGIVIEEKGRTKKGNANYASLNGKLSMQDYT